MIHTVPVARTSRVGDDILLLEVDTRGTPLASQYTTVGQFVTLSTPQSPPGFFAMATAPGAENFIFLIRIVAGNPKTVELSKVKAGDFVSVSDVDGAGYPVARQEGKDVLLVASGTGIAPIHALLDDILHRREHFGRLSMVYGAATESALAFSEDFPRWRERGVDLTLILSRPTGAWTGKQGYVQDIVQTVTFHPEKTVAFLCGQEAMTRRVASALVNRGLPPAAIFENN